MGCVGAIGVRSIAWWEGSVTLASFVNRYDEHGGGDLPAFSWAWEEAPAVRAHRRGRDTWTASCSSLSPWTVRNVRFDESLSRFHGYDLDFCLQVREAGRKVVTADVRAIHHRPLEMVPDLDDWVEAHMAVNEKWDGRMPGHRHRARDLGGARAASRGRDRGGTDHRPLRPVEQDGAGRAEPASQTHRAHPRRRPRACRGG